MLFASGDMYCGYANKQEIASAYELSIVEVTWLKDSGVDFWYWLKQKSACSFSIGRPQHKYLLSWAIQGRTIAYIRICNVPTELPAKSDYFSWSIIVSCTKNFWAKYHSDRLFVSPPSCLLFWFISPLPGWCLLNFGVFSRSWLVLRIAFSKIEEVTFGSCKHSFIFCFPNLSLVMNSAIEDYCLCPSILCVFLVENQVTDALSSLMQGQCCFKFSRAGQQGAKCCYIHFWFHPDWKVFPHHSFCVVIHKVVQNTIKCYAGIKSGFDSDIGLNLHCNSSASLVVQRRKLCRHCC